METSEHTQPALVITNAEVDKINAARDALKTIELRNHGMTVQGTAAAARALLFDVLNVASSYHGAELTKEQLHNRPAE